MSDTEVQQELADAVRRIHALAPDAPVETMALPLGSTPKNRSLALAGEYQGQLKVAKVDVDANPITPGMFGVLSIPTLMLFRGGQAAERIVGYQPKQALEAKLQAALAA